MGNRFGMPPTGQLFVELIITEDQVHVKVHGSGILREVTRYFSEERDLQSSDESDKDIIVEHYKFAINVEVEEDEQEGINLVEHHTPDNIDNNSDSSSEGDNTTYYSDSSDNENTPRN